MGLAVGIGGGSSLEQADIAEPFSERRNAILRSSNRITTFMPTTSV
jgi:hypothetical protein